MSTYFYDTNSRELYHHGIKGMKWGVRRYQNPDGSLTAAGKKRLADSIHKAASANRSYTDRYKLSDDLRDDLVSNYRIQLRKHASIIKEKRRIADETYQIENDFFDSKERSEASAKAYEQCLNWHKQNMKGQLDTWIKLNNGSDRGLDVFHDFRKAFEGYEDVALTSAEKKYFKERGYDARAADRAFTEYRNACKAAADDIVGSFGNKKVSKINSWDDTRVRDIVASSLERIDLDLDKTE